MDNFKIGDTVYHIHFKRFGKIDRICYDYDGTTGGDRYFGVLAEYDKDRKHKTWLTRNLIIIDPDTPQNRLAIILKIS